MSLRTVVPPLIAVGPWAGEYSPGSDAQRHPKTATPDAEMGSTRASWRADRAPLRHPEEPAHHTTLKCGLHFVARASKDAGLSNCGLLRWGAVALRGSRGRKRPREHLRVTETPICSLSLLLRQPEND